MDGPTVNFQRTLAMGKTGEGIIANWLRGRGFNVLPVYEKEQQEYKGPALYSIDGPLIAPDMLAFKRTGKTFWIEAKTKSAFTWYRLTSQWCTGIDLRHYEDYLRVQSLSPWPVWLLFLHYPGQAKDSPLGCPTGLFGGTIEYLSRNENHRSPNWGRSGMVYWSSDTLHKIAELADVL